MSTASLEQSSLLKREMGSYRTENTDTNHLSDLKRYNIVSSLKEISIAKFSHIELSGEVYLLDKAYDVLTDSTTQTIPLEMLSDKWLELRNEFYSKMGGSGMESQYKYSILANLYKFQYTIICNACDILEDKFNQILADTLKDYGITIINNQEVDNEAYKAQFKRVKSRQKILLIRSEENKNALEKLMKENTKEDSDKDMDIWLSMLVSIGVANSCYYDSEKVSCFEFIELFNRIKKKK